MRLFGNRKEETGRCGGGSASRDTAARTEAAKRDAGIKVLGSGCPKCSELEDNVRAALIELGIDTTVDHVTDLAQIVSYGVMSTPALVVDGKVVSYGRVLKRDEAKVLIQQVRSC